MSERSYHFIPAHRPEFFSKIDKIPADAFVFDLEDAVPRKKKADAIEFLNRWLSDHPVSKPMFVRVNGRDGAWFQKEVSLLATYPMLGLVLPKVGDAGQTELAVQQYLGSKCRQVIVLVESPLALLHLRELAFLPEVAGIGLGFEDLLSGQLFARRDLTDFVTRIRTDVAIHCAAAGIPAIDSISLDISGGSDLLKEAKASRAAGMTAMFSIHPNQVPAIHCAFSPSVEEIEDARHILHLARAKGESDGYLRVDGHLLSPPKIRKAQVILQSVSPHEH